MLIKETIKLRFFAAAKIPLIMWLSPKVLKLDKSAAEILIPLTWRSRNHLKSMYFGALCTGADLACGLLAFHQMEQRKSPVHLSFKNFKADFIKRAHGDVLFYCESGEAIAQMIEEVMEKNERITREFEISAYEKAISQENLVAKFSLGLSLRPA